MSPAVQNEDGGRGVALTGTGERDPVGEERPVRRGVDAEVDAAECARPSAGRDDCARASGDDERMARQPDKEPDATGLGQVALAGARRRIRTRPSRTSAKNPDAVTK